MTDKVDIITREVIRGGLEYIAEEMGIILRNAAYSTNIKERMDHSCSLFDGQGRMIAQAEHIPVHLGAMPLSVASIITNFKDDIHPGDSFIVNDPYLGGTHLPDITIVTPIFYQNERVGYSVSRAHHNDIGGMTPGSMPGNATDIFQEGLRIPPVKLVSKGVLCQDILNIIMTNSRTPRIRKGDLMAQLSANWTGEKRLQELIAQKGIETYRLAIDEILDYSERRFLA
ncbi:MAG: hydantoinase B/oxoprolinase family protein, partial [Candidatus Heimdallarchaeota archaeon]